VIVGSVVALACIIPDLIAGTAVGWTVPIAFMTFVILYWPARGWLLRCAWRRAPAGTVSLLPSALIPWCYLGCARNPDSAVLFRLNVLTGSMVEYQRYPILDAGYRPVLDLVPEFRIMSQLSPAYHLIEVVRQPGKETLVCRDLRTRNFHTRFGDLEVSVGTAGGVQGVRFHV
jgi:hypothetical protein